jgi:predicted ester cyclase
MSTTANKTFVRYYLDAISGREKTPALLGQFVTDEALIQHIATIEAAFPRYEVTAEDMVAEDDKVAVQATFRGTQRGEFGGVAPTERQVTVPFIIIYRIRDEKITEHWLGIDRLSIMQQIGGIPEPATTAR